jgi:hypothetical protein
MSEALGNVDDRDRSPFLQPNFRCPRSATIAKTWPMPWTAVRSFVDHAFEQASAILRRNRGLLDRTAAALLETETLERAGDRAGQAGDRHGSGAAVLPDKPEVAPADPASGSPIPAPVGS